MQLILVYHLPNAENVHLYKISVLKKGVGIGMKKFLMMLIFSCLMVIIFPLNKNLILADDTSSATDAQIKIDGNFDDWSTISKTSGSWSNFALVNDDKYVYIYIASNAVTNSNYYNSITLQANGETSSLTVETNQSITSNSKNVSIMSDSNLYNGTSFADYKNISGYITVDDGKTYLEVAVPLSYIGVSSKNTQIKMLDGNYGLNGALTSTTIATSSSDSSSSSSSSVIKNSDGVYTVGKYNIVIDGNFSDWDDIAKTDLIESNDDGNIKRAAMVSDGTNLYIYVQMDYTNNYGYNQLQTDGYELTVGGIPYYFVVMSSNNNSINNNLSNLGDKTTLKIGLGSNYNGNHYAIPSNIEAEAARIANNVGYPTDTMEIKIPLSDFTLSSQSGQIITLKNSNLGNQTLTVSGGSTGPIVLAIIGLGIALFGLWKYSAFKKVKKG